MPLLIPPPLVLLLLGAALWTLDQWLPGLRFTGALLKPLAVVLLALGLLLFAVAAWAFVRHNTSINPMRPGGASNLITSGIYALSRNPIYLADLLLLAAYAAWLGSLLGPLVMAAFVGYINRFQITPEEHALRALFGHRYIDYCSRVRRWL